MQPDFGATANDYRCHRAGFPASIFTRLAAHGIGRPGQVLVDLGTGTGTLARGFAARGCQVTGIDHGQPLLEEARQLDQIAGVEVNYIHAKAERTGVPTDYADVVSAGQCWHWFDRPLAIAEVQRILKPAGRLVIAHFDWLPLAGNLVEATEQLVLEHNPSWSMGGQCGIYTDWFRDLGAAGFGAIESFSYDVEVPYSPEAWRGRVRACGGVGAVLPPAAVASFDEQLAALLRERYPESMLEVPHRVFAVVARLPLDD